MEKCKVTAKVHDQLAHLQIKHKDSGQYAPYVRVLLAPMTKDIITTIRALDVKDIGCPHLPTIPQASLVKALMEATAKNKRIMGIARIGNFNHSGEIGKGIYNFPDDFVIITFDRASISARINHECKTIPYAVVKG